MSDYEIIDVNQDNFEEEVKKSDIPVVVDIWSTKCEKCMEIMPFLEEMSRTYSGKIKFVKLNHLGNRRFTFQFRFMGLPTFLFFIKGELVGKLTDNLKDSTEKIHKDLDKYIKRRLLLK